MLECSRFYSACVKPPEVLAKSGKFGKFSEKTRRMEFPGISGNVFRGFPGIPKILGNFSGNLGIFPKTRAGEQSTRW